MSFSAADLKSILNVALGSPADAPLDDGALEQTFVQLGLDSLALLEVVAIVRRDHGIELGDEIYTLEKPQDILAHAASHRAA